MSYTTKVNFYKNLTKNEDTLAPKWQARKVIIIFFLHIFLYPGTLQSSILYRIQKKHDNTFIKYICILLHTNNKPYLFQIDAF